MRTTNGLNCHNRFLQEYDLQKPKKWALVRIDSIVLLAAAFFCLLLFLFF